ncbi:MAG: glycosyltransferase [Nostoc sp. CreGUA01]|nr:glycosyltransferase [Nostoc sp. CreGUA01]
MNDIKKPRLVFFQWNNQGSAKFYNVHKQEHVKCLSEFFEVIVISDESDYQQICDEFQPDIALFETGNASSDKRRIKNTHSYPEIPKLAFYNGDSYCGFHSAFLSDIEHWGIETVFTISIPFAEYLPEIADNLFIWPNFIDSDVFKDYNQPKNIPVLITGSQTSLYPWRQKINKLVAKYYPTLICPHLGYMQNRETSRMLFGEQYARMLNASLFSPTCGTMAREFVRKFLEIPGSKSCLITEKNPTVEAAGFVDMQNCVFADENDILDKLDYLFQNRAELEKITDAGYQLIHSRHTFKQRDQILQWFRLHKTLKPNQRIVQKSPFEPLTIVDKSSEIKNSHIVVNPSDIVLLRQGDEKLWAAKYDEAEALYLKCLNFVDSQAQPKLRLALCNLYKGNAATAHYWIVQPIEWTLDLLKAIDPDPLEWAYLIITLLCQGKLNDAINYANKFPSLCHPELDRTRWVVNTLINKDALPYSDSLKYRHSAHQLPTRNFQDWLNQICMMLRACQQFDFAKSLSDPDYFKSQSLNKPAKNFLKSSNLVAKAIDYLNIKSYKTTVKQWLILNLKTLLRQPLSRLETRFGYFLPYEFSTIKSDEFFQTIRKMVKEEDIKTALVIGASSKEVITEALLTGIKENPKEPMAFCINISSPQFHKLQKRFSSESVVKFYDIPTSSLDDLPQEISKVIKNLKQENNVNFFDIVLIDGSQLSISIAELDSELEDYKFVLLDDINTFENYKNHQKLLSDSNYLVFTQNPELRNGYAIFEQLTYTNSV